MIAEGEYINVRGFKVHVLREGKGEKALLLLHGLPGFCYDYRKILRLLKNKFRLYAIDFKGFGHSEKRGDWALEEFRCDVMAKEVIEIIEKLDLKRFAIVGHDIGSIISQLVSQELNCESVLINPAYKGMRGRWRDIANEYWYIFFHQMPFAEKMIVENLREYISYFLDHLAVKKFSEEEIDEYIKVYSEPYSVRSLLYWYRAYVKYFRWSDIGRIKARSLILWSDSDPLFPIVWSDRLNEEFENYVLVAIPQAGHWPHIEQAEIVSKAISDFYGPAGI
ncbi:MAG: alpha/beta hydrolase [Sulfolobaceae archaeon]